MGSGVPRIKSNKTPLHWNRDLVQRFRDVQNLMIRAVGLATYDIKYPLFLATDASDFAMGAMVYQKDPDGQILPLGFWSKALNPAQSRYDAYAKELLALSSACKEFGYLLEGVPFTAYTDHRPLPRSKANASPKTCLLYTSPSPRDA